MASGAAVPVAVTEPPSDGRSERTSSWVRAGVGNVRERASLERLVAARAAGRGGSRTASGVRRATGTGSTGGLGPSLGHPDRRVGTRHREVRRVRAGLRRGLRGAPFRGGPRSSRAHRRVVEADPQHPRLRPLAGNRPRRAERDGRTPAWRRRPMRPPRGRRRRAPGRRAPRNRSVTWRFGRGAQRAAAIASRHGSDGVVDRVLGLIGELDRRRRAGGDAVGSSGHRLRPWSRRPGAGRPAGTGGRGRGPPARPTDARVRGRRG